METQEVGTSRRRKWETWVKRTKRLTQFTVGRGRTDYNTDKKVGDLNTVVHLKATRRE